MVNPEKVDLAIYYMFLTFILENIPLPQVWFLPLGLTYLKLSVQNAIKSSLASPAMSLNNGVSS